MEELRKYVGPLHSISPDDTVARAVNLMTQEEIGSLLVVENNALVGILTERDILTKVAGKISNLNVVKVREMMTHPVITINVNKTLEDALNVMVQKKFRHLPIADDKGIPIGIISARDFLFERVQQLLEESVIDPLTRIYNRRYLDKQLPTVIKTHLRFFKPVSILMCDIDHFKVLNDKYGHKTGDEILFHVAQLLTKIVRESDIVARIGGDEFVMIFQHCDSKEVEHIIHERYQDIFRSTPFLLNGKKVPVTVSFGSTTLNQRWQKGMDITELTLKLMNEADRALYHSKANGRNRLSLFEDLIKKAA